MTSQEISSSEDVVKDIRDSQLSKKHIRSETSSGSEDREELLRVNPPRTTLPPPTNCGKKFRLRYADEGLESFVSSSEDVNTISDFESEDFDVSEPSP